MVKQFPAELEAKAKELGVEVPENFYSTEYLESLPNELELLRQELRELASQRSDLKGEINQLLKDNKEMKAKIDDLLTYFKSKH